MSYLEFKDVSNFYARDRKTKVWHVCSASTGMVLGTVRWFGRWRQYIFAPGALTSFNPECLREIAEFTADATSEHREALRSVKS
jgi:hypothetical protein